MTVEKNCDKVYKHVLEKIHKITSLNKNKSGGVIKMASKGPRENIILECTECKRRTYTTEKNKRNNTDRLEIKKYCKFCRQHNVHKETK